MIRPLHSLKLARTKLHSKRGALITSIIVASLLYSALITLVIIFSGAEKSSSEFIKKVGNDQYLVKVSPYIPFEEIGFTNPPSLEVIREIKSFERQYYSDLRSKYESLGLGYDESSETSALTPSVWASESLPEEQRVVINWASPITEAIRAKKFDEYAKTATNKLTDLKKAGEKYGASGYYTVNRQTSLPTIPGLRLVKDGEEDFSDSEMKGGDSTTYGYYTNAIHNGFYSFTDQKLLGRYLFKEQEDNLKGIPVIVSAQEAVSLFGDKVGIGEEPEIPSEKRKWLESVQANLSGYTYDVCFRNTAELTLLDKIQRDYADIKNNEGVENYQKPSLIYDNPSEVCGDILIKEDTRTTAERGSDIRRDENQKKLGTYIKPEHRLLTFQIVGIKYAQPYISHTDGVDEYVKSLLISQDESAALDIPIQMYETLPDELMIDNLQDELATTTQQTGDDFTSRVLEFSTINDARSFLDNETCPGPESECDKQFIASTYGSNYLILDEVGKLFNRIAGVVFPIILGFATIIIWFTVSRIMAENRKETAIYRAMGAKRIDIVSIYLTYISIITLWIAFVSFLVSTASALAVDYFYGQRLTNISTTAFGIIGDAPSFSLFHLDLLPLISIAGSMFIVSLLASVQPLALNVRRNPMRDMRSED